MATIQLHRDSSCNHVEIPNIFIDEYMTDANGEFVKVYLYLLRCMNCDRMEVSVSAIADHFDHTEKDVMRAFKYWEKAGVLALETDGKDKLTGLRFLELDAPSTPDGSMDATASETAVADSQSIEPQLTAKASRTRKTAGARATKAAATAAKTPEKKEYSLDEVKGFCSNPEVSELLFIIETYLKHPLNSTEMNTVFFWYDGLHFSRELIEYLVEYCITNGHSSLRYMDKVAIGWGENGIDTIDKAKEHVSIRSKAYYSIMKAFGISGRSLADSELTFVNKWTKELGFDIELIQEACRRTISATQKPSFEYADSILTNWHKNQVHTMQDVSALDAAYNKTKNAKTQTATSAPVRRTKFNNFNQRNYDYDQLEKVLLTTSVQ